MRVKRTLLVPLGGVVDRRRFVPVMLLTSAAAPLLCAPAPSIGLLRRRACSGHAAPSPPVSTPAGVSSAPTPATAASGDTVPPFIGIPGSEICDLLLTVEQVWGRDGDELRDRLDAAATPGQMLALLEEELRRRVADVPGLPLVRHASGRIAAAAGRVSVGGLCEDVGVSTTHLAHRFKQIVGITPKRLARTYRFAKVVLSIDAAAAAVDWGDLAFRAGYFDQSHFVKEFQTFTGCSPTAYLALRRRFLADHPGNALDVGPLPAD